jgi:hydrogenase nickel incorporation protein HypA/HybF
MHEVSLAGGILQVVEETARRESFVRVRRLTLTIGALAGVEEQALRFALQAIGPGTCLEGAELVLESQAGSAWCFSCGVAVPVTSRLDACPTCGGTGLLATGGMDLRIKDLIVVDAADAAAAIDEN